MACAAMAVLFAPTWALAQDARPRAGDDPVLQALINEAVARNPDLMAADASIRSARERANQLSARPDPMLSTTYTNDGSGNGMSLYPVMTPDGRYALVTGSSSPHIAVIGVSSRTLVQDMSTTATGNYPGAVTYFQQRRCFAGTIWMRRPKKAQPSAVDSAWRFLVHVRVGKGMAL